MSIAELIRMHMNTHLHMQVQDVYKLLYQGTFGPAHILKYPDRAKQYLIEEFHSVSASDSVLLTEPLSQNGELIRVNLAAFKYVGGDIESLWQVLIKSAELVQPDTALFITSWNEFSDLVKQNTFSFPMEDIKRFDKKVRDSQFPTIHHSELYRQANHPAYRVVLRDVFEKSNKSRRLS